MEKRTAQIDLVKLAFFMYLYGYSTQQIAEILIALERKSYLGNIKWIHRSNLHGNLVCQGLKFICFCDERSLTVDLDDSTETAVVNIRFYETFTSFAIATLLGLGESLFTHCL